MSQGTTGATSLVRVTIASATRRVDLVLPGAVPVAELVPDLARSVGLLDPATVYGGYRLLTPEGRELAGDAGLIMQGVEDGSHLTVAVGADEAPPRIYDDVVEAMTDVVERDLKPWQPAAGRRTALGAAAVLLALGAGALVVQGGPVAGVAAVLVAVALLAGAIVVARAQGEAEAAVALSWMSAAYAAVGGLLIAAQTHAAQGHSWFGLPLAGAGLGALLTGLGAVVGLRDGRPLAIPPVVVGSILASTGLVMRAVTFDPAVVLTTTLVLVVIVGSVFPWLALGATGTTVEQLYSAGDITAEPAEIDPARVAADARVAHDILVAFQATVGLLLVLIAPLAVSLGVSGAVLAVVCCVVVMLRTRQYRTGLEVLVGLVSGIAGLASCAVSLIWLHPEWRPGAALALAVAGAVLLALTLVPSPPSLRRGRLGDVAETAGLVALLPLLVLAIGVVHALRG